MKRPTRGPTNLRNHRRRRADGRRRTSGERDVARRPGMVLVVVLVVIVVLSLSAYTFSQIMITHRDSARMNGRQLQSRALVDSGVDSVRMFLTQAESARDEAGGIYDNPTRFRGMTILQDADPTERGNFSVIAPKLDQDDNLGGVRYGLEDESARLNLNALLFADKQSAGSGRTLLMGLPGMTEEIADAILDALDEDDEPREYGCEREYYSGLTPPYAPRNGQFTTVEELLLVRGVTPDLLFGQDQNRNGVIDPHESAMGGGMDGGDATMVRGWSAYLTLYSQERSLSSQGRPLININEPDLTKLSSQLSEVFSAEWVTYILAYRLNGPYTGQNPGNPPVAGQLDLTKQPKRTLAQVLDLVDTKVQVTFQGEGTATLMASPFSSDPVSAGLTLPQLLDNCTTSAAKTIPGRINANQAPKVLLQSVPGMTEEVLTEILSRRSPEPQAENPNRRFETWLLTEGIVTLTEMRALTPFLCGGGDVFRAQIVGYYQGGQASSRAEVVFSATEDMPRILLWRDLSHLGRGYALETLGVDLGSGSSGMTPTTSTMSGS